MLIHVQVKLDTVIVNVFLYNHNKAFKQQALLLNMASNRIVPKAKITKG